MAEYIKREALYEKAYWHGEHPDVGNPFPDGVDGVDIKDVDAIPAADVVSFGVYEQVAWERDIAIQQLREDYGVELGQKKADVAYVQHGRWIEESDGGTRCSVCNKRVRDATGGRDDPVNLSKMPYCPKCGAKMDLDGGIKNDRS